MDNNKLLNSLFSGSNKGRKTFIKIDEDNEEIEKEPFKDESFDEFNLKENINLDTVDKTETTESLNKEEPKKAVVYSDDIHSIFDRVNNNVKEATDVFYKNIEMKAKLEIDLKEIQQEKEKISKEKESIEQELELIKNSQQRIEEEKKKFDLRRKEEYNKFAEYKGVETDKISELKEKLEKQEENNRRQQEMFNEEKRQFKLDKIKFENEKTELANNLLKFNELVGNFNSGISRFPGEEQ